MHKRGVEPFDLRQALKGSRCCNSYPALFY